MKSFFLMLIALIIMALITLPLIVINLIRKVYRRESISEYLLIIAIGFDQAGGSILYGQEDWTVSSWTYHLHRCGNRHATWFMWVIDALFGEEHCEDSFFKEAIQLKFKPEWL